MGKGRVKYNLRVEVSAVEYGRGLYRLTERGNERGGRARARHVQGAELKGTKRERRQSEGTRHVLGAELKGTKKKEV